MTIPTTSGTRAALPRARLGRYGLFQLRDYLMDRGAPILLLAALLLLPVIALVRGAPPPPSTEAAMRHLALVRGTLDGIVTNLAFLGTLFGINGIVADDRNKGYFRLLFAKPLGAPRFYAQLFVAHLIGLLVALAVLLGAIRLFLTPYFPPGAFVYYAMLYVGVGGIGFLASVIGRLDWLAMAAVWAVTTVLRSLDWGSLSALRTPVTALLPPTHLTGPAAERLLAGSWPAPLDALWLVGYGGLAFAAGVFILRRRGLAGS